MRTHHGMVYERVVAAQYTWQTLIEGIDRAVDTGAAILIELHLPGERLMIDPTNTAAIAVVE